MFYSLGQSQNLILKAVPILIFATENQIKMNTAEKEMLRMLSLFALSYLLYTTDNFVVLNDTIIPVQPVKSLL